MTQPLQTNAAGRQGGRQFWFWLSLVLVVGGLLYLLAPMLTPFLIAALLAYLGDPLADRMQAHGFTRTFAVITVFLAIIVVLVLVLLILIPLLTQQVSAFIRQVPVYLEWLQTVAVPWINNRLGTAFDIADVDQLRTQVTEHRDSLGTLAVGLLEQVSRSSLIVIQWVANVLLIPVLVFYLLRDWDIMIARVHELLPRRVEPVVSMLARESDEMLGSFLRGQFTVMMALGIMYSVGLSIVGLEFALLIGMLAGLVSFVPYLGLLFGGAAACVAALFQFQDLSHLIPVILVFTIGQLIEGMVLTPLLVGDKIGMHPVAVIFALLVGGHLFGFFGVLLALPVAAVVMVMLRYLHRRYRDSAFYDDRPAADTDTPA